MSANRTELGSRARGPAVTGLEGTSRIQLVPLFDGVYRKHGFDRIVLLCRGDWHEQYRPLSHDLNGVWNGNGGKLGIAELLSSGGQRSYALPSSRLLLFPSLLRWCSMSGHVVIHIY